MSNRLPGERMLSQALQTLGLSLEHVDTVVWGRFVRSSGAHSKKEVLTDIGLGKRMAAIVARSLATEAESVAGVAKVAFERRKPLGPIVIHGSEGVAVQLAKCCHPIPGDPIVGIVRKGQGLTVHASDCRSIGRAHHERDNWIEVEWDQTGDSLFETGVRVVTENRRGSLARMAAVIAAADSDIQNVRIDDDQGLYTALQFTLQVKNRGHLARIMRGLRRIPEVMRISRLRE